MTLLREERCHQRKGSSRGGAVLCFQLSQLPAHLNTGAQEGSKGWKIYFTLRGVHQFNNKEKGIRPPCSLFPVPDYPCSGPTHVLKTADTLCSLIFLSLFLSLFCFAMGKARLLYSTQYWSLLWEWEACGGCCGFLANTFEHWCCELLTSTFEKFFVGVKNSVKCTVQNLRVS